MPLCAHTILGTELGIGARYQDKEVIYLYPNQALWYIFPQIPIQKKLCSLSVNKMFGIVVSLRYTPKGNSLNSLDLLIPPAPSNSRPILNLNLETRYTSQLKKKKNASVKTRNCSIGFASPTHSFVWYTNEHGGMDWNRGVTVTQSSLCKQECVMEHCALLLKTLFREVELCF